MMLELITMLVLGASPTDAAAQTKACRTAIQAIEIEPGDISESRSCSFMAAWGSARLK